MGNGTEIDNGVIGTGMIEEMAILGTAGLQDKTAGLVKWISTQEHNGLKIESIYATLRNIKHNSAIQKLPPQIINLQDKKGWSTLMLAARDGDEKVISLLVSHPQLQPNLSNNQGLDAVWVAKTEKIRTLIQSHPNYKHRNKM